MRIAESAGAREANFKARYWKARALLELGRLDEALDAFAALQGPDGSSPEPAYYAQLCAEQLAFRTLQSFAAAQPNSYRTHQLRAEYHAAREESEKAITEYRKALGLHPGASLIHLAIGELHMSDGDYDRALAAFEAELKNDPYSVSALTRAGEVYATKEQPDKAEKLLVKAFRINPNSVAVHKALGKVYYTQGEYSKTVKHLQSALWLRRGRRRNCLLPVGPRLSQTGRSGASAEKPWHPEKVAERQEEENPGTRGRFAAKAVL